MIILVAFLMALGVLAWPVRADIDKHGKDNILKRTGEDLLRLRPIADSLSAASSVIAFARVVLLGAVIIVVVLIILRILWAILR